MMLLRSVLLAAGSLVIARLVDAQLPGFDPIKNMCQRWDHQCLNFAAPVLLTFVDRVQQLSKMAYCISTAALKLMSSLTRMAISTEQSRLALVRSSGHVVVHE